ncbi:hypothetical protein A2313_02130 [Candidatus Roizmanbacteria bacterium RIFOXYB2_FULL_41_10]|uniref:Cysteine desulfurase n=1 Tax=Candidatus Roizmanbacteria bacterium RIFOXYA1_FULL_41_12 TaxID=1802082 RepID=A0A1F7KAA7_9BACT|nr:MAG: hypothetical protein A2209_00375 [Candidatus Roizmanbacteria bacterium RIFOXYA1_FULL_41_12]OGK67583.1 MAG: hypothetical protein A2377_01930 [Candidatus Roizmanbacteria bacterium RIFOXYB1_FULL_41_27]OGK70988.1 MAG: hypothetical protein A2313_02130 [Candidatus Roizmanbacteria bacterium RIFOXYB2_FULL_41_10]OGK71163.1 MAG: hypothetical protein A2403_02735 [Candidatus Roizmanbacteria bacterium RIFOXYC1_FULL_41_16]OGK74622.1 MAG: hypothetical protein A2575_01260 [Candidatus Roizmanbacteria ba
MKYLKTIGPDLKHDFPIFQNQPDLVYLDSTATALKPQIVIDSLTEYYQEYSANVFRGLYPISELATNKYEQARQTVADFIKAKDVAEVIFVRGTTEALNLIAYSLPRAVFKPGDEIVTSVVEHHANFVPWQRLALVVGGRFKVVNLDQDLDQVVTKKTKILALNYVSNVLGTINPLKQMIKRARQINPKIMIVVDAAQAAPSLSIDVNDLDCDFLCFSGHKLMGPTGIGVLWGKRQYLEMMNPFQYGGDMIDQVSIERTTFAPLPHKFEAGTPHIAGAIGLAAAINYLSGFDFSAILKHERHLWQASYEILKENPNIKILGSANWQNRTGILAFYHTKIHAHDLAQILANDQICVRAGHHCAMPLHTAFKIGASVRLSFYLYNTIEDVKRFGKSLKKAEKLLKIR